MKRQVIIVAGGSGTRMSSDMPKQFIEIKGKGILLYTLERFAEVLDFKNIFLVLPESEMDRWVALSSGTRFENIQIAFGGKTRFDSVKAGLKLIDKKAIIGIHDSVRPFVSVETINNCFEKAEEKGAAIPVVKLNDSIRRVFVGASRPQYRDNYRLVQTPQCFTATNLIAAYKRPFSDLYTDDAFVYEAAGNKVFLVDGNPENIKLTTPGDLKMAEAFC